MRRLRVRKDEDKDKSDDDLPLFTHLHTSTPTLTDFDASISVLHSQYPYGNHPLCSDFLAQSNKQDYDWLRTPPSTPLFPSIEMEAKFAGGGNSSARKPKQCGEALSNRRSSIDNNRIREKTTSQKSNNKTQTATPNGRGRATVITKIANLLTSSTKHRAF